MMYTFLFKGKVCCSKCFKKNLVLSLLRDLFNTHKEMRNSQAVGSQE